MKNLVLLALSFVLLSSFSYATVEKERPTIMFCVLDKLDGQWIAPVAEYQLVQKFQAMGLEVIPRQWNEKTKVLENLCREGKSIEEMARIALREGADVLIAGVLEGEFKGYEDYAAPGISYQYTWKAKIVRTDSAQSVESVHRYSFTLPGKGHSREEAGKAGLGDLLQEQYVQRLLAEIDKSYEPKRVHSRFTLVIDPIDESRRKIVDDLRTMPEVVSIWIEDYRNKRMELRIVSTSTLGAFAEKMEAKKELSLVVTGMKRNRVETKVQE